MCCVCTRSRPVIGQAVDTSQSKCAECQNFKYWILIFLPNIVKRSLHVCHHHHMGRGRRGREESRLRGPGGGRPYNRRIKTIGIPPARPARQLNRGGNEMAQLFRYLVQSGEWRDLEIDICTSINIRALLRLDRYVYSKLVHVTQRKIFGRKWNVKKCLWNYLSCNVIIFLEYFLRLTKYFTLYLTLY